MRPESKGLRPRAQGFELNWEGISFPIALHEKRNCSDKSYSLITRSLVLSLISLYSLMNYLPPPQPILNKDIRVFGDVEIHPTASLAPGVILQAAPDSRIIIGADVCIGMGAIVNACQGTIEIEAGAILGSGVLIIGESKIGNNCCIGTSTTIFKKNVAAMAVIEPGSIVGDVSRQVEIKAESTNSNHNGKAHSNKSAKSDLNNNSVLKDKPSPEPQSTVVEDYSKGSTSTSDVETSTAPVPKSKVPIVGQVYLNELLVTLFPHRRNSDSNSNNSTQ